jgi:outer membrane lipoprotein SlyB
MDFHGDGHRFLKSMALIVCMTGGLAACAGADYRPAVDMTGHTQAQYDRDLAMCQNQARSVRNNEDEAEDAGLGAIGGAAGGAVLGAIGGNAGLGAGVGALTGLVGAGGYKEAQTENREQRIITKCMRAHGFNVLG